MPSRSQRQIRRPGSLVRVKTLPGRSRTYSRRRRRPRPRGCETRHQPDAAVRRGLGAGGDRVPRRRRRRHHVDPDPAATRGLSCMGQPTPGYARRSTRRWVDHPLPIVAGPIVPAPVAARPDRRRTTLPRARRSTSPRRANRCRPGDTGAGPPGGCYPSATRQGLAWPDHLRAKTDDLAAPASGRPR